MLPAGDLQSLVSDGVIGGVGGILVFLPQICILFFALSLLEDTGYLSRAAFVMDKIMRKLGLPGKAFVPLLSAHACAIPAIMSTRVIENPRDRLVTILVTPLMACSARIPVYAMVTALLFPHSPLKAALVFTAAYAFGVAGGAGSGAGFPADDFARRKQAADDRTAALPRAGAAHGAAAHVRPRENFREAGRHDHSRDLAGFVGAVVLSQIQPARRRRGDDRRRPRSLKNTGDTNKAAALRAAADRLTAQNSLQNSFAGKIGHVIEPVIAPLGYDWQIGIGIISSFAAREVIVSTLAIVYGVGKDAAENNQSSLYGTLRQAKRTDGTPIFNTATCASLLVFYILAAQCLSTTAVVRRETNSWKWPLFQIAYMTGLAYVAALVVYQTLRHFGHA